VSIDHKKIKILGIGEMMGFMNVSEMATNPKYKYDIIAESDGILAVLPFGEIKSESRKNPSSVIISGLIIPSLNRHLRYWR
jgi:hypothetical protein